MLTAFLAQLVRTLTLNPKPLPGPVGASLALKGPVGASLALKGPVGAYLNPFLAQLVGT